MIARDTGRRRADLVDFGLGLVVPALVLLVTGGVSALGGGSVVVLAIVLAAMIGVVLVLIVNRMTDEPEHPSPELSAPLEDENVGDPRPPAHRPRRRVSRLADGAVSTGVTSARARVARLYRCGYPQAVATSVPPSFGKGSARLRAASRVESVESANPCDLEVARVGRPMPHARSRGEGDR